MTVVVGYTPDDVGGAAVAAAVLEAQRRSTDLVVVNTTVGNDYAAPAWADEKQLDAVRAGAAEEGVQVSVEQSGNEEPADALLRVSAATGAELVVLGLRRRSRVAKLLLGSTAQRVLLEADCAVLVVRPRGA
jgi:nucleotide-binding universal stress UspA family protein